MNGNMQGRLGPLEVIRAEFSKSEYKQILDESSHWNFELDIMHHPDKDAILEWSNTYQGKGKIQVSRVGWWIFIENEHDALIFKLRWQ